MRLDIAFAGGEKTQLSFSALPERELSVGTRRALPYKCVKIRPQVFFVSFADGEVCTSFVIDTGEGSAVRLVTVPGAKTALSFGAIAPGQPVALRAATDDFAGNAFEWTFGSATSSIAAVKYQPDGVFVSFPFAGDDASVVTVSGFTAERLAEGVYLQSAAVTIDGQVCSVALATDLCNLLCMGGVFCVRGGNVIHKIIGGYGKAASYN